MLYIISTPIGNLGDITKRAAEALNEADLIVAEDTRRTINLLKHLGIEKKRMTSFDRHSEKRKTPHIIAELKEGKNVALVSDSGTPGINDPGEHLVSEAVKEGIQISPIPGPSAIISALVCSGLPTDKFVFHGFVPKKGKEKFFHGLEDGVTHVFYESPYRIEKTLGIMKELMPERRLCIARELTKLHEEFIRGKVKDIKVKNIKGEFVVVLR